jgi:hypothetical protein
VRRDAARARPCARPARSPTRTLRSPILAARVRTVSPRTLRPGGRDCVPPASRRGRPRR